MGAWVTGHNMAGYMPESDTYASASWEDAREQLEYDMTDYADTDDEQVEIELADTYDNESDVPDDEQPAMRAQVDAILKDDGPEQDKPFLVFVEDGNGINIVFWLKWDNDREPDED